MSPEQFQSSGAADAALRAVANITGVPPSRINASYAPAPAAVQAQTGRKLLQQVSLFKGLQTLWGTHF
jgi:hypothetical protein